MPFKSRKQERYLQINEPDIYEDWVEQYGHFKGAEAFSADEGDKCPYCYCGHENLSLDSQPPYFDGEVAWVEIQCDDCNMKATAPTYDFEFDEQGILKDVGLPLAVNMSAPNYGTLRCDSCHTRFQQAAESFSAEDAEGERDFFKESGGECEWCKGVVREEDGTATGDAWFCNACIGYTHPSKVRYLKGQPQEGWGAESFGAYRSSYKPKKLKRVRQNSAFPSGTSLQGYIKTNRTELRKAFGKPNMGASDDGKVKSSSWNLIIDGKVCTIYDRREQGKRGMKYFNIGGKDMFSPLLVAQELSKKRGEQVNAHETVPKWNEEKRFHERVNSIGEHPIITYDRAMRYYNNQSRYRAESFSAELKRDSCCCGATKSKPCACMIQGVMECNATCPCSLEKSAETFAAHGLGGRWNDGDIRDLWTDDWGDFWIRKNHNDSYDVLLHDPDGKINDERLKPMRDSMESYWIIGKIKREEIFSSFSSKRKWWVIQVPVFSKNKITWIAGAKTKGPHGGGMLEGYYHTLSDAVRSIEWWFYEMDGGLDMGSWVEGTWDAESFSAEGHVCERCGGEVRSEESYALPDNEEDRKAVKEGKAGECIECGYFMYFNAESFGAESCDDLCTQCEWCDTCIDGVCENVEEEWGREWADFDHLCRRCHDKHIEELGMSAESFSAERGFACADCGEVIIDDDYEVSDEGAILCGGQFGNNCADAESFNSYKVAPDLSSYTKAELLSSIAGPQGTAAYQEVVYDPIAQSRLSAEGVSSFSPTRLMVLGASIGAIIGLYTTRGD